MHRGMGVWEPWLPTEKIVVDRFLSRFYVQTMETRDTQLVRVKKTTVAKLGEYIAKSGSNVAYVTTEALEDWIKAKLPKRMKAFSK